MPLQLRGEWATETGTTSSENICSSITTSAMAGERPRTTDGGLESGEVFPDRDLVVEEVELADRHVVGVQSVDVHSCYL